jgi:hypothetical protein
VFLCNREPFRVVNRPVRVGSLDNSYPFLRSHELCRMACAFECETQRGPHANRFVCQCRSHVAMGLNPHARVAEGDEVD